MAPMKADFLNTICGSDLLAEGVRVRYFFPAHVVPEKFRFPCSPTRRVLGHTGIGGWSREDPYQEPEREKLGAAENSEAYPE